MTEDERLKYMQADVSGVQYVTRFVLAEAITAQDYRCIVCGQALEPGAAVIGFMLDLDARRGAIPTAQHAECLRASFIFEKYPKLSKWVERTYPNQEDQDMLKNTVRRALIPR